MDEVLKKFREKYDSYQGPIPASELPHAYVDYHGLVAYAKKKGVQPGDLSEEEKDKFVHPY